jgi:hypothetical protein
VFHNNALSENNDIDIKPAGATRPGHILRVFERGIGVNGWNCLNFGVFPHNRLASGQKASRASHKLVAKYKRRISLQAGMI